jgi:23S rRNA (uracil1939-C5)-methyltransferase
VPKSVVGDSLRIRVISETSEAKRSEIIEVLEAGAARQSTPCPHFARCGGCSLQQMQESHYREFKTRIATNSLLQAGFEKEIGHPERSEGSLQSHINSKIPQSFNSFGMTNIIFLPAASRRRAEFKLLQEQGKWSLAYMGNRSHTRVAISTCLILEPELQKIMPLLPGLLAELPFVQDIESVSLTAANNGMEIILALSQAAKRAVKTNSFENVLNHIAKVLKLTRITIADSRFVPLATIENAIPTMRLGAIDIPLPHDAFLQATREGQNLLTEFALSATADKKRILDLFCGIGTYSVALAAGATVHAVDDHLTMISNLRQAARAHNMPLTAEKRNLFTKPFTVSELKGFDAVVINPPRSGAKTQCEQLAASGINSVVMVSCNPATFARDARTLKNAGFTLKDTLAIDQFVWSPHLEIAASFGR